MIKINKNSDWNDWWNSPLSRFVNSRSLTKLAIKKLLLSLKPNKKLKFLDVGCGTGYYSNEMILMGNDVFSLDFSEQALIESAKKCGGRNTLIQFDLLSNNELKTPGIDIAFSDGLLEHFASFDQVSILLKIKKNLLHDGVVVSVVPHRYHPYTILRKFFMNNIYERSMTRSELKDIHLSVFNNVQIIGQTFFPVFIDIPILAKFFPMHLIAISRVMD